MTTDTITSISEAEQGTSLWKDAWLRLRKNHLAIFGLAVLALFIVIALLTPWIAPYSYEAQNLEPSMLKTILTRLGQGSKVVFTGDISQIDQPYLSETNNALSVLVDRFLVDATEVDVDAVRDHTGEVLIGGVMEHVEEAGHGRLALFLEGGYDLDAVEASVCAVAKALEGERVELADGALTRAEARAIELAKVGL